MVARIRPEPDALVVAFFRDGEDPETVHATDGQRALLMAINLMIRHRRLRAGDHLCEYQKRYIHSLWMRLNVPYDDQCHLLDREDPWKLY
jgi:hypothetical protein